MFGRGKKKADKADKKKKKAKPEAAKSRKAKPAAGSVSKLPSNVYTVMLLVSFLSMFAATILMWIELSRHGGMGAWK